MIPLTKSHLNLTSLLTCLGALSLPASASELVLRYDKPATRWEQEALPIGNSQMGAMLFGGIQREQIQFNEESLWIGDEEDTGAYQNFGNVFVQFGNGKPKSPTPPADYRRELDIARAVHTVSFTQDGIACRREAFASYPAKVIAYRFTADKPGTLTGIVSLTDAHKAVISASNDTLTSVGSLAGYNFKGYPIIKDDPNNPYKKPPLNFEAQVRVLHEGGTLKAEGDKIIFTNANTL
ncbi:MAG: glycoside hydrolase family 95 protein, partial [Verrucomicrobiota bacterium]